MAGLPEYEVYAIRYATREGRRQDNFIGGDPHEGPMRMDYFCWLAIGPERRFVIDCGFTPEVAAKRKRIHLRNPVDALKLFGVDAEDVEDVILTHLHYDHVGSFAQFPKARFHLQERELAFATSKYMRHPFISHPFEVDDVVGMVRLNYRARVVFHDGDTELAPGLRLHFAGGHSAGLQFVSVHTKRGWVVLASDVTHYYENMESGRPFTTTFHVGDALEGFEKLRAIAPSLEHIVPGHDPLVMDLYPSPRAELDGIAVRLDEAQKPRVPAKLAGSH
jgi:glyoxylase-like metal-dependent hydrolase (beta-lactamase superfamily II)